MTAKKRLKKLKIKYYLLTLAKFILMILPCVIVAIVNRADYFTKANTWKLSIGMIIGLVLLLLVVTSEEQVKKYFRGLGMFVVIFVLAYCFESIMSDIVLFAFCALIGKVVAVCFNPYLHNSKHKIELLRDTLLTEEVKKEIRNG